MYVPTELVYCILEWVEEFNRIYTKLKLKHYEKYIYVMNQIIELPIVLECNNCSKQSIFRHICCENRVLCEYCDIRCIGCGVRGCYICIYMDDQLCDLCYLY